MNKIINLLMKNAYEKNESVIVNIDLFDDVDDLEELCVMFMQTSIILKNGAERIILKPVSYAERNDEKSIMIRLLPEFIQYVNGELE